MGDNNGFDRSEGANLFSRELAAYNTARPPYPQALITFLQSELKHQPVDHLLEPGAGNGLATRQLAMLPFRRATLIEPDEGFAQHLRDSFTGPVNVVQERFEDTPLAPATFDLAVCATAFHWLDPATRINRFARCVRPAGHLALMWNVFQDLTRDDPFHDATVHLLRDLLASPSEGSPVPFALDVPARTKELISTGEFRDINYCLVRWPYQLDSAGVRQLYLSFSGINRLPVADRQKVVEGLHDIAASEFNGKVIRHMTSVIYVAKRVGR